MTSSDSSLLKRRHKVFGSAYRLFYDPPLHVASAAGVWITASDGKRYLDAYNNVASLGHGHPKVVQALSEQARTLNTHTRYLEPLVVAYAEKLLARFPASLDQLMLTCTGSEANDLALRIARACTGGTGVIVTQNAYHGVTTAVAELSPSLGEGVPLGVHVRAIEPPGANGGADVGRCFAESVQAAIDDLQRHGIKLSALLVDTVFSSDGVRTDPPGFLSAAVQAVHKAGGVFIADEVQAGFCRTGESFWGFQRHQFVPDIVTLGKPMGNGYPVAGVVAGGALIDAFAQQSRYFNTFAGSAVAAAVANAVVDVIDEEGLGRNAQQVGQRLKEGIAGLARNTSGLGAVRGAGLFIGAVVVDADGEPDAARAASVVNHMYRQGVLISMTGPYANVLKIRPPLVFTSEHADLLIKALGNALRATNG